MTNNNNDIFLFTGIRNSNVAFVVSLTSTFRILLNCKFPFQKTLLIATTLLIAFITSTKAQNANATIEKGNEAYKKGDFQTAYNDYIKAAEQDPANVFAAFNLGNSLMKTNKPREAVASYENAIKNATDKNIKSESYYNEGLAYIKQNDLQKAIEAFKQSLRFTPNDDDTRENLQKALNELEKQQQKNQPQNNKQQQQQKQQQKQKQQQQPKMSKQMMEQKFQELRNQEKQLQKQLQQKNNSPFQPEKDW